MSGRGMPKGRMRLPRAIKWALSYTPEYPQLIVSHAKRGWGAPARGRVGRAAPLIPSRKPWTEQQRRSTSNGIGGRESAGMASAVDRDHPWHRERQEPPEGLSPESDSPPSFCISGLHSDIQIGNYVTVAVTRTYVETWPSVSDTALSHAL